MIFRETNLPGALLIEPERATDERGHFARVWDLNVFTKHGLESQLHQVSVSFNHRAGTIRGMHWQTEPHEEAKLVRCDRGAIRDIVVDLRPNSATCGRWAVLDLDADSGHMAYIPEGFAHGFETLADATEVTYYISVPYAPGFARGFRWNDPSFGIEWLTSDPILSARDRLFPDYRPDHVSGPDPGRLVSLHAPATSASSRRHTK